MHYKEQARNISKLLDELSSVLESSSVNKISKKELNPERMLWEIHSKIFTIIITTQNALLTKDSLSTHLVARYTYEILIIFYYIFSDKTKSEERSKAFLSFNQFETKQRDWKNGKTFTVLLEEIPDKSFLNFHKNHYRNLSNLGHPTMDSFLLNRRGEESEFKTIINTSILIIRNLIEIETSCIKWNIYFDSGQRDTLKVKLSALSEETNKKFDLLKKNQTSL
jgi:hypothetical protein